LGKVGGSEKSRLLGGSEKNRLLNGVEKWSRRQRHSRCSKWPPSAWTQASSLVPSCTTLLELTPCLNQPLSLLDHIADWGLVVYTLGVAEPGLFIITK